MCTYPKYRKTENLSEFFLSPLEHNEKFRTVRHNIADITNLPTESHSH